jgi:hypothetical protein
MERYLYLCRKGVTPCTCCRGEDDTMIGKSVRLGLRQDGDTVNEVQDGRLAELMSARDTYVSCCLTSASSKSGWMCSKPPCVGSNWAR